MENVGVHFMLPGFKGAGLLASVKSLATGGAMTSDHGHFGIAALNNVNLRLTNGDRLALIGRNGAGKTTLLRVLSGILPPTAGRIRIEGRISALMSIHLGMNNEATGYDNIRSRARYMGCPEAEIEAQFDNIAAFTELGDYLALPIKTYSSGMRLRLAFAVATAFSPNILVLDEWLSAGDASFKDKAAKRLNALIEKTGIFAFASHSETLQRQICNKGLVLSHGSVAFFGEINEAIEFSKKKT